MRAPTRARSKRQKVSHLSLPTLGRHPNEPRDDLDEQLGVLPAQREHLPPRTLPAVPGVFLEEHLGHSQSFVQDHLALGEAGRADYDEGLLVSHVVGRGVRQHLASGRG